jgi:glycosyltransferase involved in cell wall biosynthesis
VTPATTTVSVVIPVKDDAEHLRRCLRALAQQTRPPDEVIGLFTIEGVVVA